LLPSVRWFLRERANRVLEEVRHRFQIEIRQFQLTRRRVLIDRLVYDAQVVEAAQAFAQEQGMPREVAMAQVERYAREIVPAFNAYFYFRLGYWVSRSLARVLYRVRVGWLDEAALAAVPREASVVFVINHRSNMDYLLVAHLAASRTALSYHARRTVAQAERCSPCVARDRDCVQQLPLGDGRRNQLRVPGQVGIALEVRLRRLEDDRRRPRQAEDGEQPVAALDRAGRDDDVRALDECAVDRLD